MIEQDVGEGGRESYGHPALRVIPGEGANEARNRKREDDGEEAVDRFHRLEIAHGGGGA